MVPYRIFFILLLNIALFATTINEIKQDFKEKRYKMACDKASEVYKYYNDNSIYLNLFAYSCIKAGFFSRVFLPIVNLTSSKEDRENATFYLTLLYQKNLIVEKILDNKDISNIILPETEDIISAIYRKFQKNEYIYKKEENLFYIQLKGKILEIGVITKEGENALFVNSYIDNQLINSIVYR